MTERPDGADQFPTARIIKEVQYPSTLNLKLLEQWASVPFIPDDDVDNPEWPPTPVREIHIDSRPILVKDESENPTGTHKDRPAWEMATLYRDYACRILRLLQTKQITEHEILQLPTPHFSLLSSGNAGTALVHRFEQYNLPPPKLLVSSSIDPHTLSELQNQRNNLYQAELNRPLSAEDIRELTNNLGGIDLTSESAFRPELHSYDHFAHEIFNLNPDFVLLGYGSGRLVENLWNWQFQTSWNESQRRKDPRLQVPETNVSHLSVLAAEPEKLNSMADKLTAPFKPFVHYLDTDVHAWQKLGMTGRFSRIYRNLKEEYIADAYQRLLDNGIQAEPSGAAGLGLYLQLLDSGQSELVSHLKSGRVVVVNTGKGILHPQ